jgi:hypothetical protein
MIPKPPAPRRMIRSAGGDDGPEPRAMSEHPKVRELVDDHRFERLGRREDQPPGEGEATLFRRTPPSAPLVADADRGRNDVEARRMTTDLTLDLAARPRLEPRLQHGRSRSQVRRRQPYDDLVLVFAAHTLDTGAPTTGLRRLESKSVETTTEPDLRPVPQTASGSQHRPLARVPIKVAAEPRLTLDEERPNMTRRVRPATATRRRNGDDHAAIGIDDNPKPS